MAPRFDVREVQDRGHYWQVVYDVTREDGAATEHGHSIPKDTLEWRAAEYGLDAATQFETILDIVLAEPYIATEEAAGTLSGEELHDAPDIETARARHVNRCAKAKLKHRISTRKMASGSGKAKTLVEIDNPFDVIRNGAVIDETVVAVKREHVRRVREEFGNRKKEKPGDRAVRIADGLGIDLDRVKRGLRNG